MVHNHSRASSDRSRKSAVFDDDVLVTVIGSGRFWPAQRAMFVFSFVQSRLVLLSSSFTGQQNAREQLVLWSDEL